VELISEIREGGTTVVLVTHLMDEAERLCDRVAVVDCGRVVACDTPQGLIDELKLPSVVRFTTSEPAPGPRKGCPDGGYGLRGRGLHLPSSLRRR
jgi:ABC-2 type transport system ATP-binding protein